MNKLTAEQLIQEYNITLDYDVDEDDEGTLTMAPNGGIIVWEHAKMRKDGVTTLLLDKHSDMNREIFQILYEQYLSATQH